MKNNPVNTFLVSIIIPVYNRADLLPETLDSVLNQIYPNWECIVVDDGSKDNTLEVIERYVKRDDRFKLYTRPNDYQPGGNGARNYGFDISNGDFIQWFDSDDLMKENFLSTKINVFKNHPELQSNISRFTFFEDDKILGEKFNFKEKYPEFFENTITVQVPVWTPSIIFRKSFLNSSGERLDESLKRLQEYEFFTRIFVKHPHKTILLEDSLCLVRMHEKTKTADFNQAKTSEMYVSYYDANYKIVSLLMEEKKLTKNLEDYFFKDHKRYITYSKNLAFQPLVEKFKELVIAYLQHNKSWLRLYRFNTGYFFFNLIPVNNFFLVYEINNPVIKGLYRNFRRMTKLLTKKSQFSIILNKVNTSKTNSS